MERKEHPVATISGGGKVLKLLDPDGNPYTPPEPVDYQILDEDGEVLKEGTIKDTDEIPLDDISASSFRVMIDSHLVLDTKGFESPVEEKDQKTIDGPAFDPDENADFDEFLTSKEDQEGQSGDDDSGTGDDSGDEKEGGDDSSSESDDSSSGEAGDDEGPDDGSKDSADEDSDSAKGDDTDSGSEDSKDSNDQDSNNATQDESNDTNDTDSDDSDKQSPDDDDK